MALRILLAGSLDTAAERRLDEAADVVRPPASDEQTLAEYVADCDALIARTHTKVTRRVLAAGKRLRAVGVAGVGLDRVDLDAARELGVQVLYKPLATSDAVAEFTVALMLQLLRPIPRLAGEYAQGQFRKARAKPHGRELRDLTVGIIGMGRIGSRVGRICGQGFGAKVLYNDIVDVGPFPFASRPVDKAKLLAESDIVTLHVPLTEQTRGMLGPEALATLPPHALLVNTARGEVVDTAALAAVLKSNDLGGAALDVTDPEPLPDDHPLFHLGNALLTPHAAARTFAGVQRMYSIVDDVLGVLTGTASARSGAGAA